jgi:hypothetical protein
MKIKNVYFRCDVCEHHYSSRYKQRATRETRGGLDIDNLEPTLICEGCFVKLFGRERLELEYEDHEAERPSPLHGGVEG